MQIKSSKHMGFCEGVKRAIDLTTTKLQKNKKKIYVVGSLIHNQQVIDDLVKQGLHVVENIESIENGGTLIVRSHGLSEPLINKAEERGLTIVNATCYKVKVLHNIAKKLVSSNYQVVLVGDHNHAEVKAIVESVDGDIIIIQNPDELKVSKLKKKVGIIAQTTQTEVNLNHIVNRILPWVEELRIFNTICKASTLRQQAASKLSQEMDMMLVIGGKNSANTRRLAEICKQNTDTYHIETKDELHPAWIKDKQHIGITAGASTPDWIIQDVIKKIEELANVIEPSESKKEEVTPKR